MPELPEVETITRDLSQKIIGVTIKDVFIHDDRVIHNLSATKFIQLLRNKTISSIHRRSKAIVISFAQESFLVVHLKMTGQLIYGDDLKTAENLKETKVVFKLSNGKHLNYNDQRLFGRLIFVNHLEEVSYLTSVGPEPLNGEFQLLWFKEQLKLRQVPIKTLLMNQSFLAGIGNIYACEILFEAKIDPKRPARRLKSNEIEKLYNSIRQVLSEAIKCRGTSMRNYRDAAGKKGEFNKLIQVYGREDQACLKCGSMIQRIVQAGRSTFYCKKCQK